MPSLRLGYVGCGFMAQRVHLPNFLTIPECEVLALAEVRPKLGRAVQARHRIPRLYEDHRALLDDPDVDAVAVSGGFMAQGEIAREALLAGKDVFMEKPMAISIEQADRILGAEERSGKRLMVAYMKRYDAGVEIARARIQAFGASGEVGPVIFARSHEFAGDWEGGLDTPMDITDEPAPNDPMVGPSWLPPHYVQRYVGYLQEYTHAVNLLRWLLDAGDQIAVKMVDLDDDGYTGVVVLDVAGVRVSLESGESILHTWDDYTQVYFREGSVKVTMNPLLLRNTPAEVEIRKNGDDAGVSYPVGRTPWTWHYKREAEFFVRALATGEPFRSTARDTRTDVRVFEDIYRIFLAQREIGPQI